MKSTKLLGAIGVMVLSACTTQDKKTTETEEVKDEVVTDDYFGTLVKDPYRWLEDDNSDETAKWVERQNQKTFSYLESIDFRDDLRKRLTDIWNYPKISAPGKHGDRYFYFKNDGLQAQSVMYVSNSIEAEGEVYLDPNTFSEDGTVSLAGLSFSDDDKYLAYGLASAGSDWNEWSVMNVETGEKLNDNIKWTKFGGASWYKDGFFYTKFPEPKKGDEFSAQNANSKIYYHKIGTEQKEDILIWEDPENPSFYNFGNTTEDDQYYVLTQSPGTHGQNVKVLKLEGDITEKPAFINVIDGFDNDHGVVTTIGSKLVVQTNKDAENYRVVLIDPENPAVEKWEVLVPETENVLQSASTGGGKMFLTYLKDASSKVYVYSLSGKKEGEVDLPTLGTASGFATKKDRTELFYSFTSFTYPSTIYRYDIKSNQSTEFRKSAVKFNADDYETNEIFYDSKDGEKIHMFVTHKKGLSLNGQNPTMLYGYGGFNQSITPSFNPANLVFLENGGVYAIANLRGGGEYGEAWHKAGMLDKKQNVFDDFIAAAEKLIADGYTSSEKLAIKGGSNGGLLVGACMTQRPELFKVALPAVGVMDMLRFHKFTVGKGWVVEYGSSEASKEQFDVLYAYSPLHNLKKGTNYPATLVMTADHDDRVVPAHSFKFAATLQDCNQGNNPMLIRIETKAGHGAGKSTQQTIDEYTDQWAFVFKNLGMKPRF